MPAAGSSIKTLTPVMLAFILFAAVSGVWYFISGKVHQEFEKERARLAGDFSLECAEETWGGYPFRIKVACSSPVLVTNKGDTRISAKQLIISALVYDLKTFSMSLDGPSELKETGQADSIQFIHDRLLVTSRLGGPDENHMTFMVAPVTIKRGGEGSVRIETLNVQTWEKLQPRPVFTIDAEAVGVTLTGPSEDIVKLEQLGGRIEADNTPQGEFSDVTAWMKAAAAIGTKFNVERLKTVLGETAMSASGQLQIQPTGLIDGVLRTKTTNLDALLSRMQQARMITESEIANAKSLVGLLDKGEGVKVDIRFKDGNVYWGPFKLGWQFPLF